MSILHIVKEDVCEALYSERVRAMMKGAAWSGDTLSTELTHLSLRLWPPQRRHAVRRTDTLSPYTLTPPPQHPLSVPQHPRPGPARGRSPRPPDQRQRMQALFPNLEGRPSGPALCLGRGSEGLWCCLGPWGLLPWAQVPQPSWAAPAPIEWAGYGCRSPGAPGLVCGQG